MKQTKIIAVLTVVFLSVSIIAVVGATCSPREAAPIRTEDNTLVNASYYAAPSPLPPKDWSHWFDNYASQSGVFYDEGSGSWSCCSLRVELASMQAAFDMQDAAHHATAEQRAIQTANVIARYHEIGVYA
jgi:hypothetical protein